MNFSPGVCNLLSEAPVPDSTQQLYEQTLVLRSQLGDELAFQELLKLHGPRLLAFTRGMMLSSPQLVEDVMQETWLAIYKGLPGLRETGKFRPWAFRIARNLVYRSYRRRRIEVEPIEESRLDEWPETDGAAAAVDVEELHRGLDALSPAHREVLVL